MQNVPCFSGTAAVHAKQPRFPVKGTGAVFASLHVAIQEGRDLAAGAGGAVSYTHLDVYKRQVEQLVARRAHNPEVAGSSPVSATRKS